MGVYVDLYKFDFAELRDVIFEEVDEIEDKVEADVVELERLVSKNVIEEGFVDVETATKGKEEKNGRS